MIADVARGSPALQREPAMNRLLTALIGCAAIAASGTLAQSYPSRPIKPIVPFAAVDSSEVELSGRQPSEQRRKGR
jgi:hypothetical protein